jgi:peptide/nickel transport system permease protein
MANCIIRRLLTSAVVLFMVSMFVFLAMRLLPGDPVLVYVSSNSIQNVTEEQLNQTKHEHGLDKSIPQQYISWVDGAFHGDFGKLILNTAPVLDEIVRRLPITLYTGVMAFIVVTIMGIPAGVWCAVRRGKRG